MTSAQFNGAQFDEDAVPDDRAHGATTQDEELGQHGRHRRSTGPRLSHTRGRVETVAWSAAVLTGVVLAMAHGVPGTAHHGTPGGHGATAPPSTRGAVGCLITSGRPATGPHPGADARSRQPGTVPTDLPRCATVDQRAAESAYLAQLSARHHAAIDPLAETFTP